MLWLNQGEQPCVKSCGKTSASGRVLMHRLLLLSAKIGPGGPAPWEWDGHWCQGRVRTSGGSRQVLWHPRLGEDLGEAGARWV